MDSLEFDIARIRNVQLVSEEFIQHLCSVFMALRCFRDSKEAYIFSSAINLLVQKLVFQLLDLCVFSSSFFSKPSIWEFANTIPFSISSTLFWITLVFSFTRFSSVQFMLTAASTFSRHSNKASSFPNFVSMPSSLLKIASSWVVIFSIFRAMADSSVNASTLIESDVGLFWQIFFPCGKEMSLSELPLPVFSFCS